MTSTLDLRQLIADFVIGGVPLAAFDRAIADLGAHRITNPDVVKLWGCLALLLGNHEAGQLDDRQLRDEVARLL